MKYLGGKNQIAWWVKEQLLSSTRSRKRYVEPFVGSAAIWMELAPQFAEAVGSDAMPDLVLYLNAIRGGWIPPNKVSEETYYAYQDSPSSAMRGHVGFNCSWGGMFFRGYGSYEGRDEQGARVSRKMGRRLRRCPGVSLLDYREADVRSGDVVYCDPPYGHTEPYRWLGTEFDTYEFWGVVSRWTKLGAHVFVSEQDAPANWVCVAEIGRKALAAYAAGDGRLDRQRTERIYVHESRADLRATADHGFRVRTGQVTWPAID